MKKLSSIIIYTLLLTLIVSCSATRYVPQGKALLLKNEVIVEAPKTKEIKKSLAESNLESYIQQRPNKRVLGVGLALGFYNLTDTTKHNGWHKFWRTKVGAPPVIYDSTLTLKSIEEIDLYLSSIGFFNAKTIDTVKISKKRKATVVYKVSTGEPYKIGDIKYNITDKFLEQVVYQDTASSLIKTGMQFSTTTLEQERTRITQRLKNEGYWGFGVGYISYTADSTVGEHKVDLNINIRQFVESINTNGQQVLTNHPIYRLGNITVNSYYDPTINFNTTKINYDTLELNGINILYNKKPYIKPNVLVNAVRLSPYEIYDLQTVTRTRDNLRNLGYSANVLFNQAAQDENNEPIVVTLTDPKSGKNITTTERLLNCVIQCTPNLRQSFTAEAEISTTANYYSGAISLGYQNLNLFNGGEVFSINFRGAYELMKSSSVKNAFEFGVNTSLTAPRFWLPISKDKEAQFKNAATKISISYSIQRRPDYHRELMSGVFGYSWTLKNGARFTINPVDINLIKVPWVSTSFLESIDNPYLRNSYESQMIGGMSASYYYTTNPNIKLDGVTLRANMDVNGNLFRGITSLFAKPIERNDESFYTLFGLRFAQYARATFDVSGRNNLSDKTQFAWRFLIAGGYAYGNSKTIPFERLLFAGGANSMRGWQVRTLGPGSVFIGSVGNFPNQLGDLHLEANIELRQNLIYGLSGALFFDAGNIWMNSAGENRPEARFKFNKFYKQIALNTGLGIRYDIAGMMIIRFDWGLKLHNPNMPVGDRWFRNLGLGDSAFHFAIGLPF